MPPTGETSRVIQIHPTRRCNLQCLHCYSSSGPEERGQLDAALLCEALTDAAREGYTTASFSGGEPVLYKPLGDLLRHACACGMKTTVTSNGMLLDAKRLEPLREWLDVLAISLDGVPASHNRNRASERAFEAMQANLPNARASGVPFGFIFTLTQYNLDELEWVADFALEQGAALLQIHPLEEAGRAQERCAGSYPDTIEGAYACLEVERIRQKTAGRMTLQVDYIGREALRQNPDVVYGGPACTDPKNRPLSALLSPLVVEADGMVTPIQYGFARRYALGNLHEKPLRELSIAWRSERYADFSALCRRVYADLSLPDALPIANWYEVMARYAERENAAMTMTG